MSTTSKRARLWGTAAAGAVAALAIVLSVAFGVTWPVTSVLVLGVGAGATVMSAKRGRFSKNLGFTGLGLGLVVVAASTLIDQSIVAGVVGALCLGIVALVWHSIAKQLAPAEALSPATVTALDLAGVQMAEESAGGWQMGATPDGVVVLVKEIAAGEGVPKEWKSVRDALTSLDAPKKVLATQGIDPLVLAVVPTGTLGPTKVEGLTVCSPGKIASSIRSAGSSVIDPRATLEAGGIVTNRQVARQIEKRMPAGKKNGRVVHQGRVTKRVD